MYFQFYYHLVCCYRHRHNFVSSLRSVVCHMFLSIQFSFFSRQPLVLDVPYSRLLDTPSKNKFNCDYDCDINRSTAYATHRPIHDARLQRSLRISPPKTSASDSRLTADFVHDTDNQIKSRSPEMSSSAPHSNQMDEEELSIRSPCNSDATLNGNDLQVQRTISLTSENQSEVFFSADEEMHASQKSDGRRGRGGKKKCASDLGIGQGGPGTRLSSHRSDYEINTPEHRSLPKRPQSTTDVVSSVVIHGSPVR